MAAILLVAGWFRFYQLNDLPPGLTHDEANNAHDAAGVLTGVRPLYFPTGYGHEPLYAYLVALVSAPTGVTDLTLRLTTALCGLAMIVGSYLLGRRAFDPGVALTAAAVLAISFWPVFSHRQGVRPVTLPLLFVFAVFFLWRGLSEEGQLSDWALSGLFTGGTFYTYLASRLMLASLVAFAVYLALFHRATWQRVRRGMSIMLIVAVAVITPLAAYLVTHPAQEVRVEQLVEPLTQARQGNLGPVVKNLIGALKVFSFAGDSHWRYNVPGRPIFDPLTSIFLYLGLGLTVWRWRQPAYAFLLLWLLTGLFPGLVTGAMNSTQRTMGAQPAIYLTLALGVVGTARWLWAQGHLMRWAVLAGLITLVLGNAWLTYRDYFVVWAAEPDAREVYHVNLREIARYLDKEPDRGPVAISTEYPSAYHDPYILEAILQREDLVPRWFDGRGALVIPVGGAEARYIFPAAASLHPALRQAFFNKSEPVVVRQLRSDDINYAFTVYRSSLSRHLTARLDVVKDNPVLRSSEIEFKLGDPDRLRHPLAWPVDLGHRASFLAYELEPAQLAPGETLQLLTYWRVLATPAAPAVIFVHLLDAHGQVKGAQDRLDAPVAHWQPGDVVVQVHAVRLDPSASAGTYQLEMGVYDTDDASRWPVFEGDVAVADRLLLKPIEVRAP
ncbi:MAG: glycosyltransferase family 39 protein [Anaerolineae bacterium]|nr:MAG: glycosyltransferase family 39 protein [Anaerolineae bacterium]